LWGILKRGIMRKGIVYSLVIMLLSACSGLKNDENRFKSIEEKGKGIYYLTIEAKNGDNSKQQVEISIDPLIIDSLKLSEQKIIYMCEDALRYADWNANFKPSYKQSDNAMLTYDTKEKKITAFVNGTAENAYGVRDILNSTVPFNLKGIMINDKDGLPDIFSF